MNGLCLFVDTKSCLVVFVGSSFRLFVFASRRFCLLVVSRDLVILSLRDTKLYNRPFVLGLPDVGLLTSDVWNLKVAGL